MTAEIDRPRRNLLMARHVINLEGQNTGLEIKTITIAARAFHSLHLS
jgi:hypothetical protein